MDNKGDKTVDKNTKGTGKGKKVAAKGRNSRTAKPQAGTPQTTPKVETTEPVFKTEAEKLAYLKTQYDKKITRMLKIIDELKKFTPSKDEKALENIEMLRTEYGEHSRAFTSTSEQAPLARERGLPKPTQDQMTKVKEVREQYKLIDSVYRANVKIAKELVEEEKKSAATGAIKKYAEDVKKQVEAFTTAHNELVARGKGKSAYEEVITKSETALKTIQASVKDLDNPSKFKGSLKQIVDTLAVLQDEYKTHRGAWNSMKAPLKMLLLVLAAIPAGIPLLIMQLSKPLTGYGVEEAFFTPPKTKSSVQLKDIQDKLNDLVKQTDSPEPQEKKEEKSTLKPS